MIEGGTLALIVGPSGVGKDSLIALARERLAEDHRFNFPCRAITRSNTGGPEIHVALTQSEFDTAEAHGAFLLSWRAHDVAYGIPSTVVAGLEGDRVVVANASRAVIATACSLVRTLVVVHVTAPRAHLLQRLALRGRESKGEIEDRLARSPSLPLTRAPVIEIDNSGSIEIASAQLIEVLLSLVSGRTGSAR